MAGRQDGGRTAPPVCRHHDQVDALGACDLGDRGRRGTVNHADGKGSPGCPHVGRDLFHVVRRFGERPAGNGGRCELDLLLASERVDRRFGDAQEHQFGAERFTHVSRGRKRLFRESGAVERHQDAESARGGPKAHAGR